MAFKSPFDDVMVTDGRLSVLWAGEWQELVEFNRVPAHKIIKVAGALDGKDDAASTLKRKLHEVMEELDAALEPTVSGVFRDADCNNSDVEFQCQPLTDDDIPNFDEKIAATTAAFSGVLQLARLTGAIDKHLTKAFLLAATTGDAPELDPMQMAAQMAAMGGMPGGMPGGPPGAGGQQCQQQ